MLFKTYEHKCYTFFPELKDSSVLCNTACGVGTCIKTQGKELCICPPTHYNNGTTCIGKYNWEFTIRTIL